MPYLYAAAGVIMMSLIIVLWGIISQQNIIIRLINVTENQTKKTADEVNNVKKLKDQLKAETDKYKSIQQMAEYRNTWFELLNELGKCLPDNTWIIELDPSAKLEQLKKEEQPQQTKTLFGKRQLVIQKQPENESAAGTSWIKIRAHTLSLFADSKKTEAEQFKDNLLASPLFTKKSEEIVILDYRTQDNPSNNIDTFIIMIKLAKLIPN